MPRLTAEDAEVERLLMGRETCYCLSLTQPERQALLLALWAVRRDKHAQRLLPELGGDSRLLGLEVKLGGQINWPLRFLERTTNALGNCLRRLAPRKEGRFW